MLTSGSVSTLAQEATPEREKEPRYISDFAHLRGVVSAVGRYAYSPSPGLASFLTGDLHYVTTLGFELSTEAQAKAVPLAMVDAYQDWVTLEQGRAFRDLNQASARSLGDESWGWVARFSTKDDRDDVFDWALFAVRKGTVVQVLIGASKGGTPIRALADISEEAIERWPNDRQRYTYEGEPAGGLWDTLPRLGDLQEGMVIEDSYNLTEAYQR